MEDDREKKLQAGRLRLAKFQQKKSGKKASKKSKQSAVEPAFIDSSAQDVELFTDSTKSALLNEPVHGEINVGFVGEDRSPAVLDEQFAVDQSNDDVLPAFASDELYGDHYDIDQPSMNGYVDERILSHNDLVNDLRKQLEVERDTRQRSEDQFRQELSESSSLALQLERQLQQQRQHESMKPNDEVVARMQAQHANAVQLLQAQHDEEVNHVRAEEQRKRAEQVQSLTTRLQVQHKEDTDALRLQLQQVQSDVPNDTAHLQQMVVLMREQYEQEAGSRATEHKRDMSTLAEKHQQELLSAQQQSVAQMEAFRNQVQESVSAQVTQFHEQYQSALEKMKAECQKALEQAASLEAEKQSLLQKLSNASSGGTVAEELRISNEQLAERLSTLQLQYDSDLNSLRQQSSTATADYQLTQAALARHEREKEDLAGTIAHLERSLHDARDSGADVGEHNAQQLLNAQHEKDTLQQQMQELEDRCAEHVNKSLLDTEKSLVLSLTADLERALTASGDLEGRLQSLTNEFHAYRDQAVSREGVLESEVGQKQRDYNVLSESHRHLQAHMQESLAHYAKQVEELASAAAADSTAASAIAELRSAYEEQFEQLRGDFELQEESVTQQHRQELADMAAQNEETNRRILADLQQEKDRLAQFDDEFAQVREDLRRVAEERSGLATRNTFLEQRVKEQSGENQSYAAEAKTRYDDVVNRHEEEHSTWTETERSLRGQFSATEAELTATRQELADIRSSVASDQTELSARLPVMESEVGQLRQEKAQLEARLKAMDGVTETTAACRAEISRLGRQLEEKDDELSERSDECSRLESELSQSLSDLALMQSHMDNLARDLRTQQDTVSQATETERTRRQGHEQEVNRLNSRLCHLEKALSEQEEAGTAKNALVAELENRLSMLQSCQDDLNAANNEVELLRSRLASWQPPDASRTSEETAVPESNRRRDQLQSALDQHKDVLEEKLAEKTRLDALLEEQRGALVQQLLEKAKLESLLQEKNRLETELIRQRGVLEKELGDLDQSSELVSL